MQAPGTHLNKPKISWEENFKISCVVVKNNSESSYFRHTFTFALGTFIILRQKIQASSSLMLGCTLIIYCAELGIQFSELRRCV